MSASQRRKGACGELVNLLRERLDDHKARRNWHSGTQRYAVLQPIYERAIEDDKARIQAEANQARSEKAKGQHERHR